MIEDYSDALQAYFSEAINSLREVDHKCLIPVLPSQKLKQIKALVTLLRIAKSAVSVDTGVVRAFRIWQKALLSPYIDECQEVMFESKKSIFKKRLWFIVKLSQARLRKAFSKWLLFKSKLNQRIPNLVMSHEQLEQYSVLKLLNLVNCRKTNAMGV